MPVYPQAHSKSAAGVTLALCHYTLSIPATESPDPWNARIYDASLIGEQGSGQQLTQDDFRARTASRAVGTE